MAKANRYIQALKENENVVGMASAAALSVATLNPLPLLIGAVAEVGYLLTVPDSKWYAARLSRREWAAEQLRRQKLRDDLFPTLSNPMQERFVHLETVRKAIAGQVQGNEDCFTEVLQKLDYLLEKFLVFAAKEAQFRNYLGSMWLEAYHGDAVDAVEEPQRPPRRLGREGQPTPRPTPNAVPSIEEKVEDIQGFYQGSIDKCQALAEHETEDSTKAVLTKRIEVLQQRKEFAGRIGKILTNLTYQLGLLEDTFGLINDQIRARTPDQVLADIDSVVYQTDSMTELLDALGPYEQLTR